MFNQGTVNVGKLTKNAKSLEDIVVQQYRDIKSRLAIKTDFDRAKVSVELTSNCPNPEENRNLKICKNVVENQVNLRSSVRCHVFFVRRFALG